MIGNTFYVMEIATGEIEETVPADGKDPAAKALGKKGAPDTYLCPPSMDRRSAVEGVLMLALSFRSIVKHSSLTASFWTVSASLATWQKAMAR